MNGSIAISIRVTIQRRGSFAATVAKTFQKGIRKPIGDDVFMNVCNSFHFGEVDAFEFGYGFIARPFMTVFLYHIDDILIDTAQPLMHDTVVEALRHKTIRRILLTHHHEDHSGNAAILKKTRNVSVYANPYTREKMKSGFKIRPYQHVMWGRPEILDVLPLDAKIEGNKYTLIPIHTPGHSKDHTVFLERSQGWLFSGDLYLADRIKYFRADEKFGDTVRSLKRILKFDFDALFCAHNPAQHHGKELIGRKLDFLENFLGQVGYLLQKGYGRNAIVRKMSANEVKFVKLMTLGNVSLARMISSACDAILNPGDEMSPQ